MRRLFQVSAASGPVGVEIRVTDQGPGVSSAMQPRLFDRFATGRHTGGTGLGLFIVRELARAQGGDAFYDPASAGTSGGGVRHRPPGWLAPPSGTVAVAGSHPWHPP